MTRGSNSSGMWNVKYVITDRELSIDINRVYFDEQPSDRAEEDFPYLVVRTTGSSLAILNTVTNISFPQPLHNFLQLVWAGS